MKNFLFAVREALINWSIILAGLLLYNGLGALTLIFVARQLSPVVYGQYMACFALASFLVVFPGFGMETWLLTQYRDTRESSSALWRNSLRVRTILLVIWALGALLLTRVLPPETYPPQVWLPTVIGVAMDSVSFLAYAALRGRNQHKRVTIFQSTYSSLLFVIALVLPTTENYVALFATSRMFLSLSVTFSILTLISRETLMRPKSIISHHQILAGSGPFLLSDVASAIHSRADLVIISLIIGASGTSIYGPAINMLEAFFLAPKALFLFFMPILSKVYLREREFFTNRSITQTVAQTVIGLIGSIILFFFSSEIIDFVFQTKYESSAQILQLLSPIPLLRSVNYALGTTLGASNRQKRHTNAQMIAAVFNISAGLAMVTPYGLVGMAVVYVISDVILLIGSAIAISLR